MFPPPISGLIRPLEPALFRLLIPDKLRRSIPGPGPGAVSPAQFAEGLLRNLDIRYEVADADLRRIPTRGSGLIVANHPFGFLEGLIFLSLLERVRTDYRIMANGLLSSVAALRERLIFVNPFQEREARYENGRAIRASIEFLSAAGLLVMFPAGEVAHLNWAERPIADPKWSTAPARLARNLGCFTLPVFFEGANSMTFQLVGTIHPRLRTLNLPRELSRKSRHTVRVHIGTPISAAALRRYGDADSATDYIRARTYLLMNRSANPKPERLAAFFRPKQKVIDFPRPAGKIADEIAALGADRMLLQNEDFAVYLAPAAEIPNVLREIGRCREMSYRAVGEGTGNSFDLDEFDEYYNHLFMWARADHRIAGAYRIAATPDVLPKCGVRGLYTSTLFQYEPGFFERLGPALELGRSFICAEYQKHYAPLLFLWKGIAKYVEQRPECAVLFGAVSISSNYHSLSQTLIVNFLRGHLSSHLADWVRPRREFRSRPLLPRHVKCLNRLLPSLEELSASVQDLESDGKALPVLIRQYLKLGGEFVAFNVDAKFSNAIDALLVADLRTATQTTLERCMGREGASAFRNWHAARSTFNALSSTREREAHERGGEADGEARLLH